MSFSLTDGRVLSNGRYRLVLTSSGTGFSAHDHWMLTRWNRDALADCGGLLIYLRDVDDGRVWSAARQPIPCGRDSRYRAQYRHGSLRITRSEHGIESICDAAVADTAAEVRRLTLRNVSPRARRIEVTTYLEVVLHVWAADTSHPGFSKLFVQTDLDAASGALWARRRPRSAEETFPFLVHALHGDGTPEYETDRARFIGRGRTLTRPLALDGPLSGTLGSVLDPVLSMRRVVHLAPDADTSLTAVVATAADLEAAIAAAALQSADELNALFARAADTESRRARRLKLTRVRGEQLQRLAVALLYGDPLLRPGETHAPALVAGGSKDAPTEGPLGDGTAGRAPAATNDASSGSSEAAVLRPPPEGASVVVHGAHAELDDDAGRAFTSAARYWKDLGLPIVWTLVCEDVRCHAGQGCAYEILADQTRSAGVPVAALTRTTMDSAVIEGVDGSAQLVVNARDLAKLGADVADIADERARRARLKASAPVRTRKRAGKRKDAAADDVAASADGRAAADARALLGEQSESDAARGVESSAGGPEVARTADRRDENGDALRAHNGYGGFTTDGTEYRIVVDPRTDGGRPPLPWINVVANPQFGFLVSESGAGTTWSRNSHERRLTPWSNDPICDPHGEALYVADAGARTFWSPLPGPAPAGAPYEACHGFGYSRWRHVSHGIEQDTTMFVPPDESVKVVRVRLRVVDAEPREISLVYYARLVLGDLDVDGARMVTSEIDAGAHAIFARSRRGGGFDDAVVFAGAAAPPGATVSLTADRVSFLGVDGTVAAPAALVRHEPLDGRAGEGLDPCAAVRVSFTLGAGEQVDCAFLLGEASTTEAAIAVLRRFRERPAVDDALNAAREGWRELLGAVEVKTPNEGVNLLANGWALYQAASCRLWGRSAFYQSGGAYGFRDQLQDSAAFVYTRPDIARAQILLHAGHQFREGDVLHWWHPPIERGTRTRFADDLCWLPYLTAFYVATTGDDAVLDELAPFVDGPLLAAGQDEAYISVTTTEETASVYEHCCRALDRSLTCGTHGLPLFGTGDWNDGMNRVGRKGKGESVWMAFFLYDILGAFAPLCRSRGDTERAERYEEYRTDVRRAIESVAWDGEWYRRGYYDDGSVLGSAQNDECRIDVVAQSWAVLSGAASPDRCASALDAVEKMLVVPDPGLIRLLTPPFDRTPQDPGYIKGYVPGIRENGGQYTHGALWAVRAAAQFGQRERAARWLDLVLPLRHAATREGADVYKVEPYVIAADVYGVDPHLGRGGWTWYTGSASWMYRTILESVLGITVERGRTLVLRPRIPDAWPGYRVDYRLSDGTSYVVDVVNPEENAERIVSAAVDGRNVAVEDGCARIALMHDGSVHEVRLRLGA